MIDEIPNLQDAERLRQRANNNVLNKHNHNAFNIWKTLTYLRTNPTEFIEISNVNFVYLQFHIPQAIQVDKTKANRKAYYLSHCTYISFHQQIHLRPNPTEHFSFWFPFENMQLVCVAIAWHAVVVVVSVAFAVAAVVCWRWDERSNEKIFLSHTKPIGTAIQFLFNNTKSNNIFRWETSKFEWFFFLTLLIVLTSSSFVFPKSLYNHHHLMVVCAHIPMVLLSSSDPLPSMVSNEQANKPTNEQSNERTKERCHGPDHYEHHDPFRAYHSSGTSSGSSSLGFAIIVMAVVVAVFFFIISIFHFVFLFVFVVFLCFTRHST